MLHRKTTYISRFFMEYPSIFYEKYLIRYLSDKNFNKEEIDYFIKYRNINTLGNSFDINGVLGYIGILLSGKKITEEDEIIKYINYINSLPVESLEVLKHNFTNIDIMDAKTIVNKNCDNICNMLIKYPYRFNLIYSYIIGSYLADKTLEKVSYDENFLVRMKYITENLSTIDPSIIFNELDLDIDEMRETAKEYCKV